MGVIRGKAAEGQKKSRQIYILRGFWGDGDGGGTAVIRCNMRITVYYKHNLCS